MSLRWYVVRRTLWTVFAAYLMLSAAFFLYAYTPDPNEVLVEFGAGFGAAVSGEDPTEAQEEALQAYREARNYDEPIAERYANWMVGYATFNWGYSFDHGRPVTDLIADRLPVTLVYLVPGILLALVLGLGVGLLAAMRQGGPVDRLGTATAYVGLGLPHFFLAELLIVVAINELGWYGALWDSRYGLWSVENLTALALPMLVVTANLLAVQVRYARAEALEFVPADFVKRLRASGASSWRIARHVLRNAALPLLSVFFTETLTVLFVTVYVIEVVMEVPGLGSLAYHAIFSRDIGIILATTFIPVLVGLVGNLVQDVAYTALDPRVSYDD